MFMVRVLDTFRKNKSLKRILLLGSFGFALNTGDSFCGGFGGILYFRTLSDMLNSQKVDSDGNYLTHFDIGKNGVERYYYSSKTGELKYVKFFTGVSNAELEETLDYILWAISSGVEDVDFSYVNDRTLCSVLEWMVWRGMDNVAYDMVSRNLGKSDLACELFKYIDKQTEDVNRYLEENPNEEFIEDVTEEEVYKGYLRVRDRKGNLFYKIFKKKGTEYNIYRYFIKVRE